MSINTNDNVNNEIHWGTWKVLLEIVYHNNGENAWEKYDSGFIMHWCPSKVPPKKFYSNISTITMPSIMLYMQSSTWKVGLKNLDWYYVRLEKLAKTSWTRKVVLEKLDLKIWIDMLDLKSWPSQVGHEKLDTKSWTWKVGLEKFILNFIVDRYIE